MVKTTESIFEIILVDVYFDFLVWSMSHSLKFKRWDIYRSLAPGGDLDTLASLLVDGLNSSRSVMTLEQFG